MARSLGRLRRPALPGRGTSGRPARDAGTTHVLEAVLLTLILLGAAYSVTTLRETPSHTDRSRTRLAALTGDALVVLEGLEEERGSALDLAMADAFHCSRENVVGDECQGKRGANLSLKLESYLPDGAGYAYGVGNGVAQRILYRSHLPAGESVSASITIVPDWNLTFVLTDLSCYEGGMDVRVEGYPVWHGAVAKPVDVNFTAAGVNVTAVKLVSNAWEATFPGLTRPASALVLADVNATDGTYPGAARYGACNLAGLGPSLATAARGFVFTPSVVVAPLDGNVTFTVGFESLDALATTSLLGANVTIYAPVPPRGTAPEDYAVETVIPVGAGAATARWDVPPDALYGAHLAVLTARVAVTDGAVVDLRKAVLLHVGLPTGGVPIDPPYRIVLQTWFPDWS